MKKSKKRLLRWGSLLVAVAIVAAGLLYYSFVSGAVSETIHLYISSKSSYDDVKEQLYPHFKTPIHRKAFDIYASRLNLSERFRTGHYKFDEESDVIRMVRKIALGEQSPVRLVIKGARTLPQLAGRLSAQIDADSAALLSAMRSEELRKELGLGRDSIISIFIPNTYEVYWSVTPEKLIRRMNSEYNAFWNKERTAKLKRCGLSKYEVMTLASIIYEEVKAKSDMVLIAGVFINRLRQGMPLQACPTVRYAVGDFTIRRVLNKHLKIDSPFNTYKNKGLPPAPICIPSIVAIDAVLNYTEHDYLYFCARPEFDGRHNFARTYEEHRENARRYTEALDRRGIKK